MYVYAGSDNRVHYTIVKHRQSLEIFLDAIYCRARRSRTYVYIYTTGAHLTHVRKVRQLLLDLLVLVAHVAEALLEGDAPQRTGGYLDAVVREHATALVGEHVLGDALPVLFIAPL